MSKLTSSVLDLAATLPQGQRGKVVAVLHEAHGPDAATKQQLHAISAGPDFSAMVARLIRAWEVERTVSGSGLALAIEATGRACAPESAAVRPTRSASSASDATPA